MPTAPSPLHFVLAAGAGAGSALGVLWCYRRAIVELLQAELRRAEIDAMPERIILVRHGESEANVDHTVWSKKPDNMIELTEKGCRQAREAGKKIKELVGDGLVMAVMSPFWRTNMTMRNIRKELDDQVIETRIEPRVREQEFGNTQHVDNMKTFREIQKKVGRFWYRFPEGESGADVYERVASVLTSIKSVNKRPDRPKIDNVLVVSHGLTMRLILSAEMAWSPDTFHTVWNPQNCEIWVLKKTEHGTYRISPEGSFPKATRDVDIHYKSGTIERRTVEDYLDIPQPRTCYPDIILNKLGIPHEDVEKIDFWCGQYSRND